MKALVLSGGTGTRLRPFSHSMPKQLIPVANRPVLEHVLDGVRALGVSEVGIVVGDQARAISEAVGDGSRFGLDLTYIRQDQPRGLAHAVQVARPFLGADDFAMFLGDCLLADGVTDVAERFRRDRPAADVVVHKVADPRASGVVELDGDGGVVRLVEKPQEPRSDLAIVGAYFFTLAIHAAVDGIRPSSRGELEITDAIQWLVDRRAAVRASEYAGYWKDLGQIEDVLDCNQYMLSGLRGLVAGEVDAASVLDGDVVVEPGARVLRSRIEGPAIIGAGTLVEESSVGPHTSVGRDCVLRRTQLADSIVMDGARITAVRDLRRSLVGRAATVGSGGPERGNRMLVGDHSRVEIVG
ncbi:glucose-1-phosphate thymidylyltransferase [Micromonospora sp. NPDC049051]|uniref:glucose-1-phosphate thymidylyltransferase n=1 Tax=unclassified Micromonospora TaxID=2617518 RepID=UPI003716AE48